MTQVTELSDDSACAEPVAARMAAAVRAEARVLGMGAGRIRWAGASCTIHGLASPSEDLHELIDLSEALQAVQDYLPRVRFILDDLARIDEDELQRRTLTALARAALLLFRNARTRRPDELRVDLMARGRAEGKAELC